MRYETNTLQIPLNWDYSFVKSEDDKPAEVLLLHGFMQTAGRIASQIAPVLESLDLSFRAIQAPFPVYKQLPDRFQIGYSWYFFDHIRRHHVIEKEVGLRYAIAGLEHWGELSSVKTVIGFSQGAYLAALVGKELPGLQRVIGIGGRFMAESFSGQEKIELIQIHGLKDQVVDPHLTEAQHKLLKEKGLNSQFIGVEGVGHEVNDQVRSEVSKLLGKA